MNEQDIREVENNYFPGYDVEGDTDEDGEYIPYSGGWIAGTGDIRHEISGRTAEMVLEKIGRTEGTVTVVESHRDGGYCVTCSFEYLVFLIQVDGETVYDSGSWYGEESPFAMLQSWLTGKPEAD